MLVQLKPLVNLTIYQGRDLARATELAAGQAAYWFGPELFGGGALPGNLYYLLLALPIALTKDAFSTVNLMFTLYAIGASGFFVIVSRRHGTPAGLWAYAVLLASSFHTDHLLQYYNPSFLLIFFVVYLAVYFFANKHRSLLLGLAIGLGGQIHGSFFFLIGPALFSRAAVEASKAKQIPPLLLGLLVPLTPFLMAKFFFAQQIYQGGINNSFNFLYTTATQQYADWLSQSIFLKSFLGNFISNLKDHFFSSPVDQVFLIGLATSVAALLYRKSFTLSWPPGVSLFLWTTIPCYFWMIAFYNEAPRYATLPMFTGLFCLSSLVDLVNKDTKVRNLFLIISSVMIAIFFAHATLSVGLKLNFWVILFAIVSGYLLVRREPVFRKQVLVPLSAAVLLTQAQVALDFAQMPSPGRNDLSIASSTVKIMCPRNLRTLHERAINDPKEYLNLGSMRPLAKSIVEWTGWSTEIFRKHTSMYGVSESNDFLTVYKAVGLATAREGESAKSPGATGKSGNLFVFNSYSVCILKNRSGALELPFTDFVASFGDVPDFVSRAILESKHESKAIGSFLLVFLENAGRNIAIGNLGSPYRIPDEYLASEHSDPAKSGVLLTPGRILFYFKNEQSPKGFGVSKFELARHGETMLYRIDGLGMAQPSVNGSPAYTEQWNHTSLEFVCASGERKSVDIVKVLGNIGFKNELLAPYSNQFGNPCTNRGIKEVTLKIDERAVNRFRDIKRESVNLRSGDLAAWQIDQ